MRLSRLVDATTTARGPQPCRCGHITMAHEHYRRGSDCALCECARYRRLRTGELPTKLSVRAPRLAVPYAVAPGGAHEHPGAA